MRFDRLGRGLTLASALLLSLPTVALGQAELSVFSGYVGAVPSGATAVPELGGYYVPDDPTLVHSRQFVDAIGPHEGHADAFLSFRNDYWSDTHVNGGRAFGCPSVSAGGGCLFVATPGHSGAFASGWADASVLGLGVHSESFDHGAPSAGEAIANAVYRNRFTVGSGTSGLAPGDPVTLRWTFRFQGNQDVTGRTYPSNTAALARADVTARVEHEGCVEDPEGGCLPAVAARFGLSARADANDVNPAFSGGITGEISNDLRWSAATNRDQRVDDQHVSLQTFTGESAPMPALGVVPGEFARLGGFEIDTARSPVALPFLDFEATVGETLELIVDVRTFAIFGGGVGSAGRSFGAASNAFFGSFESGIEDPNGLGLEIVFEISGGPPPTDTTPPRTAAAVGPTPNAAGWNNTDVTVTLTATDEAGGSGVKEVVFSLTGAQSGRGTVPGTVVSVPIAAEGVTTLTYFARDHAGNQEASRSLVVRIDRTPPIISGLPAPGCTLWPPDHRLVSVGTVDATDALSGLQTGSPLVMVTSNETVDGRGTGRTAPDALIDGATVWLRAERAGNGGGRVYSIAVTAEDLAGNMVTNTATCAVPHDRGRR